MKARSVANKAAESADGSHRKQNGSEAILLEHSAGVQRDVQANAAKLPPRGGGAGHNFEAGQNRKRRQDKAIENVETGKLTEPSRGDDEEPSMGIVLVGEGHKTPVPPIPSAGQTLRDRMLTDALRTKFRASSGEMTEAQVAPCS